MGLGGTDVLGAQHGDRWDGLGNARAGEGEEVRGGEGEMEGDGCLAG